MAEAKLDNGQYIYALNDIFIGRKTHVSARYSIVHNGFEEKHSSSGIIVSTGTGSTGWLTSILTGAKVIAASNSLSIKVPFPRNSEYLVFAVREPFPTRVTGVNIVYGEITRNSPLLVRSNMPEEGVIFGDGIETDYLDFNSGRTATIQPSDKKVYLVKNLRGKT